MIALEVSSAAGPAPHGGIGTAIRNSVSALLQLDPNTSYALCYRFSRWRRGHLFRPKAPNARLRLIQDPLNGWLLRGCRLFHSMGIFMPRTPRATRILTIHDLNAVRNTQWVRPEWHEQRTARIRDCLSRSDHVVTYSAFTAGEVCEEFGLAPERVHPVLLGVDPEAYALADPALGPEQRARLGDYVIAIGLVAPHKNMPRLVEAVARIPDLKLVIVGRPARDEDQLQQTVTRTGMSQRVVRMHGVPHQQLVGLLRGARACAVPSLYEGFGLTPLEAMACDTPVVCSTAASLPEVTGDAALSVDATDVDSLSDGLRRVLEDESLASKLRERGRGRVREMSWQATGRRLRELYSSLA